MLTLRSRIGLTQAALAEFLGVSRRVVGEWESGKSYPKTEHLKRLLAIAHERKALPARHEPDEVRFIWQASRQKVLLDESWLVSMLSSCVDLAATTERIQTENQLNKATPEPVAMEDNPRLDWDDALTVPNFYGRDRELNLLKGWVVE
jgi:transcriptional regulator with XRE-family HTH domain